ncbi:MAG: MBL fold metallo-hydrolase [Desulfobacteraceae bacterium]|nr:MAG: MBL fold metallo-hydrolase [Desulfobacteraceae bacterium]
MATQKSNAFNQQVEKNQAIQVIAVQEVTFENPLPDVYIARIPIANASWVATSDGVVVIDTLLFPHLGRIMKKRIAETCGQVKYVIYTHGHKDHIGGAIGFLEDSPIIIGQRLLPERLEKYRLLNAHGSRISSVQFNIPERNRSAEAYVEPSLLYDEEMQFRLGDKTFELFHARGETDDTTWVYVPEIQAAFVGDLIISGFPNIGNPFKPTRFALPWARALEAVRDKDPQLLVAHGGQAVYQGAEVRRLLDLTIEAIRSIHDQVVDLINRGVPVDEMIHMVALPDHLKGEECLQFRYSRPEFAVYNIYRWYHGYFDQNPANLLPRPQKEVNAEIIGLIADPQKVLSRVETLIKDNKAQLALQVLDILLQHDPESVPARRLRLRILEKRCEEDYCLMSRNTWVYFMEQDKAFLSNVEKA